MKTGRSLKQAAATLFIVCSVGLAWTGEFKTWGRNNSGQLGLGDTTDRLTPADISGLAGMQTGACGNVHTLAKMSDGTLSAWGCNAQGQLGLGDTTDRLAPTRVTGLAGVQSIACGAFHSIALLQDGTIRIWGWNGFGQLGLGDTMDRPAPTPIAGLSGVKAIAGGSDYSVALMNDGTMRAWGGNSFGQLGLGDTTDRLTPTVVPGLSGVLAVAAGGGHTLALLNNGTVSAWGLNDGGQLGLGDTANRLTPTLIPGLSSVQSVACGGSGNGGQSMALLNNGTLKAWGWNNYGQLGLGNTVNRPTPTLIPGLSSVQSVACGANHTLARLGHGAVQAWGFNSYGELGVGDAMDRSSPTPIPGLSGMQMVAGGGYHSLAIIGDTPTVGPVIKANGATKELIIKTGANLSVTIQLDPGPYAGAGVAVDWWIIALAGQSWFSINNALQWVPFDGQPAHCHRAYGGALFNLPVTEVLNITGLASGRYTFWFLVDYPMDGILNFTGPYLMSSVVITVL